MWVCLCNPPMTRLVWVLNWVTLLFLLEQVISQTTLFLAAKVEEQPRKLEHVIKIAHAFLNPQEPVLDTKSSVSKTPWFFYFIFSPPGLWFHAITTILEISSVLTSRGSSPPLVLHDVHTETLTINSLNRNTSRTGCAMTADGVFLCWHGVL